MAPVSIDIDMSMLAKLRRAIVGGARAAGYIVEAASRSGTYIMPEDAEDKTLIYARALQKACTALVEEEQRHEALREAIRGGSDLEALQEAVAVAGVQKDERHRAEGLAGQDVLHPGEALPDRVQEPRGEADSEAGFHHI